MKSHMPQHGQGEAMHSGPPSGNHVSRGHVSPLAGVSNPQQQPTDQAQIGGLPLPPGGLTPGTPPIPQGGGR
jgi:hypothetical protein